MDIAYVTSDWGRAVPGEIPSPGGAGWVRIHQPAMMFAAHDHNVVIGAGIGGLANDRLIPLNHVLKPLLPHSDIMVIQRWMNDEAPDAIRKARKAGQVILQDVDDWFWGLHEGNRAFYSTDRRRSPEHNRDHYKAAVEASDGVTVSTDFLARRLRERMGVRTHLIRNCVDPSTFATEPVRDVTEGLRVGWVGALAWRSGDLETMRSWFPKWLKRSNSTFVHHGTFPGEAWDAAAASIGVYKANTGPTKAALPPMEYPQNVAGFDIGIVPLNDVPFNHAKSWIKGLEYAAAGIPFIAFRTKEYEALGAGLLASTPNEWVAAFEELRDPATRREQQQIGLKAAREHSIRARWTDWEKVYLEYL